MKKHLGFLFVVVLISSQLCAQTKSKVISALQVEYHSSQKTILVENNMIIVTEFIEEYDNPVSSMPSKRTEKTKKAAIPKAKLDSLTNLIKKSGFMTLPKNEYGISASERFYPYTIAVKNGKTYKKVLYRSNPSGEKAPQAFSDIEIKLNQIVNSISQWQ
ncbi:MAG: hypothetical protein ACJ75J_06660 [Cytophagaceae bacterium]